MKRRIAFKGIEMVFTILFVVVVVFVMSRSTGISPCDDVKATPEFTAACEARWGLDQPMHIQLGNYLSNLARFEFGTSYQNEGTLVAEVISEALPMTLKLVGLALPFAIMIGVLFGVIAAVRRNTSTDYTLMGIAMVGIAVPEFVIGPVLILIFSIKMDWIPRVGGLEDPILLILPVITLALPVAAGIARLARVGMLDVLNQDFIRTARAKGLKEGRVIIRHAMRLGLVPVVSYLGPVTAGMLAGGSFIVETLFGIPGVGHHFVSAATGTPMDYPMIMGATTVLATLMIVLNFAVDVAYTVIDPRLRNDAGQTQEPWLTSLGKTLTTIFAIGAAVGFMLLLAKFVVGYSEPFTEFVNETAGKGGTPSLVLAVILLAIGLVLWHIYRRALRTNPGDAHYGPSVDMLKQLSKHRFAIYSLVLLYTIIFACVFGPWLIETLTGITYETQKLRHARLAPPWMEWFGTKRVADWMHLFGTDSLGRDVLIRTLVGGRVSLSIGFAALLVTSTIGVLYGTTAAYFGGVVDRVMMRFVDVLYSIPFLILVILLVAFLGKSILLLFIAIGCVSWLTLARIARGQALTVMKQEYVQAAMSLGASAPRIMLRHVIPNSIGPLIIYATKLIASIILFSAFLSFLGFGVQEPMSSWGILIRQGNEMKEYFWWMLVFPSMFLALTLLALNYSGDGLRDALDPKLKGVS